MYKNVHEQQFEKIKFKYTFIFLAYMNEQSGKMPTADTNVT